MARPKGSKNKSKTNLSGAYTQGSMHSPSSLFKFGSTAKTNAPGISKEGEYNVTQSPTFFYSPELTTESWLLPKSRQEILKWVRIFFNLEPYIQSVIMMHSLYPFSKFEISTSSKEVTEFYNDMAFNENFDLFKFIMSASLSYQKFGEAICFGNMEQNEKDQYWRWSKFVLLEPELVEIQTDMFSGKQTFELIPTEELKQMVTSNKPEDIERREKLQEQSPEIVNAIMEKRNIRLDGDSVSSVARLTDPSATRGTSPVQACFKVLIYQDWIRLAQSAFAQRYVFPIELWTIGDLEKNIIPTDQDLTNFRNIISSAIQQPPFSLVFPPTVKYEPLSTLGKQFPINNEYEYIQDQLLVALGVNKNIILGEGPSFSNVKTMALHKLMMTYKVVRDEFENWMIYKFFKPIAEKNGFYTTVDGKRKLILPEISWHKSLDIEEQEAEKEQMLKLHADGFLSTETLYSKFPSLDYKSEQKKLELERGTVWDKGSDRIPQDIKKAVTKKKPGKKGPGGGVGSSTGFVPPEPIEPIEPTEEGAEGAPGIEPREGVPEAAPEVGGAPETAPETPTAPAEGV